MMAGGFQLLLYVSVCFVGVWKLPSAVSVPAGPVNQVSVVRRERHIIDQLFSHGFMAHITRTKRAILHGRFKRSVQQKELEDPGNCIHKCWDEDEERTEQVQTNFENKLHLTDQISEDEMMQKGMFRKVMANLPSLLSDTCQAAKTTKSCLSSCPSSLLKDIAVADYYSDEVACGSGVNQASLNCIKDQIGFSSETCEQSCHGKVQDLRQVCQFEVDRNESDSSAVQYEGDSSKNYEKIKEQCKITTCTRDCTKDYLLRSCKQKDYDLYASQLKVEPKSALVILQKLGALKSDPPECNSLK